MLHGVRVNVGNDEQPAGLFELRTHLHSEAFMGNTQKLIEQAYSAFNNRDIDSAMALMSENVSWPKASEGGRVVGKGEIRSYWTRQWQEFDPHVEPLELVDQVGRCGCLS